MEPYYIAIGFYKGQRRYIGIDTFGRIIVTEDITKAAQMQKDVAAVAAFAASVRFNITNCRAVEADKASSAEQI